MLVEHTFETIARSLTRSGFEGLLKSRDPAFDPFVKTSKVYDGGFRSVLRDPRDRGDIYQCKLPKCCVTT